jgi:hypothetical protein
LGPRGRQFESGHPDIKKASKKFEAFCILLSVASIAWRASRQGRQFESGHPDIKKASKKFEAFCILLSVASIAWRASRQGRQFESGHPDIKKSLEEIRGFLHFTERSRYRVARFAPMSSVRIWPRWQLKAPLGDVFVIYYFC